VCSLPGFYAPKADLTAPKSDFRFTPESGLMSDISPCPKSANSGSRRASSLAYNVPPSVAGGVFE
jgi:hypothetical protein